MGLSLPHLIVLALVVLLLFGRGKVSDLMGEFGKGIRSFKDGVADETTNRPVPPPPAQLTAPVAGQPPAANAPAQTINQATLNGEPVPPQGQR
jgi:sec-independent protein translocase protein TatA